MATRIYLVRHGETTWNRERRCQGVSDIPLSDTGIQQAECLSAALAHAPLSAVYASDLVRARHTAEIIAAPHKLPVSCDARLRELNQGRLEGSDLNNLLSEHPELLREWLKTPADVTMPGGESMRALQARASRALEEIIAHHQEQSVAVIAHNLCNLSLVCRLIGLDLNLFRSIRMDNASITEIECSARGAVLFRVNDIHHLGGRR